MTPRLDDAVELLDRALSYTRVALASVSDEDLAAPTPCRGWNLGDLLAHMEDSLDAFAEGGQGAVPLAGHAPAAVRVRTLQQKACALLGTWSQEPPHLVSVGGTVVDSSVVVLAAALEITVHGWDVATSTRLPHPFPEALAVRLLPVARALVVDADRGVRFAEARQSEESPSPARQLLGFLGRNLTGPEGEETSNTDTGPRRAS